MTNFVKTKNRFITVAKSDTADLPHDGIVMNKGEILLSVFGLTMKTLDNKKTEELPENNLIYKGNDRIIEFMNYKRVYE